MVGRMQHDPGAEAPAVSESAARLLDGALELFFEQGARATTVRQITSSCGLTPGAFYNHFESKEELLYQLIRTSHDRLERSVSVAQAAADGEPAAELDAIIRVYVERHARRRKSARIATRDYIVLTGDLYEEIVAVRRRLRERLIDVVQAGQRQGVFRLATGVDAAPTLTAVALLDMCIQVAEWYHEGHGMSPEDLASHYIRLARRMVGVAEQDDEPAAGPGPSARRGAPVNGHRNGDADPSAHIRERLAE